ncbi:hypothetical protein EKH55_0849 [Sinorhizobium alkalisoli]|nr:hypothetical protein EKH55_0849 [Sinorhizobium alkalisoli]
MPYSSTKAAHLHGMRGLSRDCGLDIWAPRMVEMAQSA